MGRALIGLLILTLSTVYSSAYHQYHHFKPRDLYDEYHDSGKEHSAEDTYDVEVDEPNIHEELNAADPVYDAPNLEAADLNEIPNARANAPSTGYEVTEDVDDIPNPEEFRPIVANYSRPKPLNFARPNNDKSHSNIVERETDNNKDTNLNRVELTHENFAFSEIFPEVKESFEGVKNGFEHDLKSIKDKVFKKLHEPMDYLNKLHGKANNFLDSLNRWFGYKHENEEDFETF